MAFASPNFNRALACLDENAIAAYLQQRLVGAALATAEEHLSTCADCRRVVEEMAIVFATDSAPPDEAPLLGPGAQVGRYVVLRMVGAGSFGVVYAAFDPELDRKIALKVLRSDRGLDPRRFLSEARAMARLSHPNVTQVYDVHADGDRLSIAMEFIEGTHLAEWLQEPRSWREILRVFLAAGAGLAAAHAAGLVHRDFKPANILIGADGRISVTDFGLALAEGEVTSELIGTPRYMAPEQYRGEGSAAADQFSFGVALHEALHREHPFEWRTRDELEQAVRSGKRKAAAGDLPRWLKKAIGRSLDPDPAQRHPSMDAMLAEISVEPRDRRNRRLGVAAFALLLAAIPMARVYDTQRREARLCKGAAERVAEVWHDEARAALRSSFAGTKIAWAPDTALKVEQGLDAWFSRWARVHTDTCEATRVRGEQSDEVLTERMLCLARARAEARALIAELTLADGAAVGRAIDSVRSLPPFDECSDVEALMTPLAPPRRIRVAVENVREALAEARAIRSTGRHAKALAKSTRAAEDAGQLDHAPVLAEAWLEVGRSQAHRGQFVEAQGSLREAIHQASRGHHDRAAAEAWVDLVFLEGAVGDREEVALALWEAARAAIARIPGHPALEAKLDSAVGIIEASLGEYAVALTRHQAALAAWERAHGKRALEAGLEHHRLAEVLLAMRRVAEAEDHAVRSQDILREAYGAEHPVLALPLTVLAEVACAEGEHLECGRRIERAMGLRASAGTPRDHPTFLPKRLILVRALAGAGKIEDARRELDAALSVAPDDLWRARALLVRAEIDRDEESARRALELLQANLPATHPELQDAHRALRGHRTTGTGDTNHFPQRVR